MPDQKPLRLTTDERNALATVLPESEWDYDPDRFRVEVAAVVEQIVKAREAAARREALLEAERLEAEAKAWKEQADISVFRGRLRKVEAKVARVEALAKDVAGAGSYCEPDADSDCLSCRILAALAEPERDEEGGR